MDDEETARVVIAAAIHIHKGVGPGLFESTYSKLMGGLLIRQQCLVETERYIDICLDGIRVERAYRIDMVVNGHLIVELKSVEHVAPIHLKQLYTYQRLADIRLGLLINFSHMTLKEGIHRRVNGYARSPIVRS